MAYNQTSGVTSTTTGGAPGPTQTGIVSGCEEWYVVKANDTCPGIAKEYSISQAQFYAWNPAVGGMSYDYTGAATEENTLSNMPIQMIARILKLMMPIV